MTRGSGAIEAETACTVTRWFEARMRRTIPTSMVTVQLCGEESKLL